MISFENDYSEGAHEEILRRLAEVNKEGITGYGNDSYCESAKEKIRQACKCPEADIYFLVGGTQTNQTVIDSVLQSYEGVIAAETGHVASHEAGAIEASGHKVLTLPQQEGKIQPKDVADCLNQFYSDGNHEHMVFPGMVYISHPTEYGTLYTRGELAELSDICQQYHIPLYLDGARLGYGLAVEDTDVTNEDIKKLEVYSYSNGNVYCELAEINDLIKVEINSYWRNTGAEGWKCTDQNFCEMIFLCLQGLIDKHITQRHIQYNKTAERRIGFNRIRKVLDSDDSIKRCEEYYLYNIKNKLLMMCGEYHEYCLDEWDSEEERVMFCKQCEVSAFYEHISRMSEDKIRDLIHTINPNVLKKIDEMNWAEYCIIDRYKNPFFKGLRDINSTFEKDRDYISYVGKNKTLNLLTTVGNRDGSKKALMRACGEIVANPNLYEILMDVNCLISRDLETDSIYDGAGDFLKEFEIEEEHIYHCKNIKMEPLEDAIVDIDGGIEND